MAKHNAARNATPRNAPAAPLLVLGQSLQQALAQAPSTPAMPAQVPGALATSTVTLAKPAPVVVAPAAPSTPVHPTQVVVKLGKAYNVRSGTQFDNVASWQATCAFLASKGGQATVGEIAQHLKELRNHANFAAYAVRRGYLQPVA
jgi:hypothetical protein